MNCRAFFYIFAILFFHSLSSLGLDTLALKNDHPDNIFIRLSDTTIQILRDPSKKLSFEDVRDMDFKSPSPDQVNDRREYLFSDNNDCIWMKFIVHNKSIKEKYWMIEYMDFNIKKVSVYFPDDKGNYTKATSGFSFPFLKRAIIHKNFEFNIPYSDKPQVCYARVDPGTSTVLSVEVKTYHGFIEYSIIEYYLLGLFYGIILIMGIYNLILYVNMNESHYLFYVFYVICVGLSSMCHDGTGFQFLWPDHPKWNEDILIYSLFGLVLWTLFYSKWFLNTKVNAPFTDRIIQYLIGATAITLVGVIIFRPDNLIYLIPLSAVPFLIIYVTGIKIFINGFKPARFFLMAFTFFFLGYIIRILTLFNLIQGSIITIYSYNIGVLVEMILFSIAIGDRIKTLKQETVRAMMEKERAQHQIIFQLKENQKLKDKVNRELEEKVTQRTQEIKQKNQDLEIVNEQLKLLTDKVNGWNIRLDLDNRKLQTNVKEIAQARVMLKDVKFDEFSSVFPDERACLKYLADLKWKENYQCKKCGNTNYGKGKSLFGRRCTKCNYDESPTNDTLFHRLRFPITKAFYLVYLVNIKDKDITADELSEILTLRRETCWSFKKKINIARKNMKKTGKSDEADGWAALALISFN